MRGAFRTQQLSIRHIQKTTLMSIHRAFGRFAFRRGPPYIAYARIYIAYARMYVAYVRMYVAYARAVRCIRAAVRCIRAHLNCVCRAITLHTRAYVTCLHCACTARVCNAGGPTHHHHQRVTFCLTTPLRQTPRGRWPDRPVPASPRPGATRDAQPSPRRYVKGLAARLVTKPGTRAH